MLADVLQEGERRVEERKDKGLRAIRKGVAGNDEERRRQSVRQVNFVAIVAVCEGERLYNFFLFSAKRGVPAYISQKVFFELWTPRLPASSYNQHETWRGKCGCYTILGLANCNIK